MKVLKLSMMINVAAQKTWDESICKTTESLTVKCTFVTLKDGNPLLGAMKVWSVGKDVELLSMHQNVWQMASGYWSYFFDDAL